jgi:hypothetical protein
MHTRLTRHKVSLFLIFLLLPMLFPKTGFSQTTNGTILGTVSDATGAVVPGASITIKNIETGASRTIVTDDGGRYRVPGLALGKYEVSVEHTGFSGEVRSGVELTVGREAVVDFNLKAGDVQETVRISEEAPLVTTTNGQLEGLVNERTVRELPLNGRDVFQLTTLQVGVTNTAGITTAGASALDVGPGATKIAVNGARIDANGFMLDGTIINDSANNTPGSVYGGFSGVDTLREFQILTNSYNAEYGQGGGAIINAVTKSGTNSFHGTAFYFHRNSALDARNFFDAGEVPEFKRNQFGGSVGGPIKKSKTFFFAGYEGLIERLGVSRRFAVPTASARARAVPSIRPYVNLYPLPNAEVLSADTANYLRSGSDKTDGDSLTGRIDHQIGDNDSFFGRYTFDNSNVNLADGVIQDTVTHGRNQYLTLGEDHIFSPRVLNSFRFGFTRSLISGDRPYSVSVPDSLSFVPGRPMGSFFGISEVAPLGSSLFVPRFFVQNTFQFTDNISWTRGAHSFKFGGSFRRIQLNADSVIAAGGAYVFFGLPPIPGVFPNGLTSLDAFLLGFPVAFQAPTPGADFYRGIRESVIGGYFQDEWKVNRKLTVNYGLRYEAITTPTESNDKIANLRSVFDKTSTVGEPFFKNPSKKNFAPRVGFAYDLFGDGRTSVRGGFGIFDNLIMPFNYRFEISGQPPFSGLSLVAGFPAPFPNAYSVITTAATPQQLNINAFQFDPKRSYMEQWNLSVQRELLPSFVLTAAYVGSHGVHLARKNNLNQRTDFVIVNGRKFFPNVADPASKRLNPTLGAIREIFWDGNSNYNALQLRLDKRFSHGLSFQSSYTWSKAIDDASTTETAFSNTPPGARLQDAFNTKGERGRSAFDTRHNFVTNVTYEFPRYNLKGAADTIVNGWELTGILTHRTGFPFSVFLGFDRANDASIDDVAQRPDIVPGRTAESAITGNPNAYIDPTAFRLPPAGTYGDAGRNILEGPGFTTFDLGVYKNTTLFEKIKFQFRAEFFNLFNHANFAIPDNVVVFTSDQSTVPGNFGRITRTTSTSRQIQLGMKFIF